MAVSDSWLRAVNGKPQAKMVTKSDREGLSVRVTPKGKVIFQYRYRWQGKGDRIDIGTYPAISLKDARDSALFYRRELEQHRNPKVVKRTRKQQSVDAHTVESVIRDWWEKTLKNVQVNAIAIRRSFEIYVFPKIGNLPHDETHLHVWLSLIEEVVKAKPAIGARILLYAKTAHRWGIRRGIISLNPLIDVTAQDLGVIKHQGERVLSNNELRVLFALIDAPNYNPRNALIIKLALLFGCRIGELLKAKITDFDFTKGIWTVPPENHKTGRKSKKPIIRPIIPAAEELIKTAKKLSYGSYYLFTVSEGKALCMGGHLSFVNGLNKKMAHKFENYTHWSIHDLRKTMRTGVAELTQPHVAEIMLGHKLPGVWQVYDKHTYLEEQREAYERWWTKVNQIVYPFPNPEYPAGQN
ncbi:site-specific integrase [Arsenophonus nasoniae]|uniref:Prophage CPS-53 integrase n=4 Tax=Arsenophonus nasoniae TaxID=638 RepID=A0A4P7KTQ8_9GAMM|nr:site-specific integrase [Arsenophonus nasoniae]QBY43539.1 Putative prophage CPS-53 integrase [Arsenophonus nasoniae]WGM07504.1 site-specific integrase [Arsenophonus nasoniae]WGM12361.1 site-specific integrase [Arsenophonus nasoniae]WGM17040.1 site-specific integrase [Arsenophonus nasoniae]